MSTVKSILRTSMEDVQSTDNMPVFPPATGLNDEQEAALVAQADKAADDSDAYIESMEALMDRNSAIVEGLESLASRLMEYGDQILDKPATEMLYWSMEAITDGAISTVVAPEELDAGDTAASKSSTVVEKAKEILIKIWEAFKAIVRKIKEIFHKILGVTTELKFRAKSLKEDLGKHDLRTQPASKTIEVASGNYAGLVKELMVQGNLQSDPLKLAGGYLTIQDACNSVDDLLIDRFVLDVQAAKRAISTGRLNDAVNYAQGKIALPPVFKEIRSDISEREWVAGPFPGDRYVKVHTALNKFGGPSGWSVTVGQLDDERQANADDVVSEQIPAVTANDLVKIPDLLTKIAAKVDSSKDFVRRLEKASETTRPDGSDLLKASVSGRYASATYRDIFNKYRTVGRATIQVNLIIVKGGLQLARWANASLAEYPKKV